MPLKKNKLSLAFARQALAVTLAISFCSQQTIQAASTPVTTPAGGAYVAGTGSIKTSGNAVTINQSTLRGIIDWSTFSIGQGGTVTFKNGTGATLNRVTGSQMSSILGSLFATGSVYLLNPEGLLIGPGAHVKTGGDFVASTLDLPNDTFMTGGSLLLQGTSKNVVVNLGDIYSAGGSVFLVGHDVSNSGSIKAANGTAGLAAGSEVLLKDSTGDQRIFVMGSGGDVTNTGLIQSAQAELRAKGGNIYALAGNNASIAATGTASIAGKVWLISDGGTTQVQSKISAQNANGFGGAIETSGYNLDISKATVKTGQGGTWLLDPVDLTIDSGAASTIQNSLATTDVTVSTDGNGGSSGPGTTASGNGDIIVANNIAWASNHSLTLSAYEDIDVNSGVTISNSGAGNLTLRADNTSSGTGTVNLNGSSLLDWSQSTGIISLLYNPAGGGGGGNCGGGPCYVGHSPFATPNSTPPSPGSYANPTDYSANILTNSAWTAPSNYSVSTQFTAYMLVNNADDVQRIPNSGTFGLGTDIDLTSISNFIELGQINGFTGIFDGLGHTLSNLTISNNDSPLGLFAIVGSGGIVRNVNLTNGSVTSTTGDPATLGMIAGINSGIIANVTAAGTVSNQNIPTLLGGLTGDNTNTGIIYNANADVTVGTTNSGAPGGDSAMGGLAGQSEGTIANSVASGTVNGAGVAQIGGLVGQNTGTISNSSASGPVSGTADYGYVGGLVGENLGTLTNVFATGAVTDTTPGTIEIGGLLGYNGGVSLSSVYATGNVTASDSAQVGGLIGHDDTSLDSSYATGSVTVGSNTFAGGLIGYSAVAVTNSHATGNVTSGTGGDIGGLTGWSPGSIASSNASGAVNSGSLANLGGLSGRVDGATSNSFATGNVTGGDSSAVGGLIGAANGAVSGSNATGTVTGGSYSNVGGLVGGSISTIDSSFATGAVTGTNNSAVGGLGGNLSAGSVTNSYAQGLVTGGVNSYPGGLVGIEGGTISTSYATGNVVGSDGAQAGGLVGTSYGAISASHASGSITSGDYSNIGGLVGVANATIDGSYATGSVSTGDNSSIGGLAGIMSAAVTNSYAQGSVTAGYSPRGGGLIGYTNAAVSGSNASGAVSSLGASGSPNDLGGLIGYADSNSSVSTSYATGSVTSTGSNGSVGGLVGINYAPVTTSYATGNVTAGDSAWVGGLVGENHGPVSSSYATGNVTGGDNTDVGGLVGNNFSPLSNTNATGVVVGADGTTTGGLVGNSSADISTSTASGSVSGGIESNIGGLAGSQGGNTTGSSASGAVSGQNPSTVGGLIAFNSGQVNTSYATGSVTGSGISTVGGLIGYNSGPITNSYATGAVTVGDGIVDTQPSFAGGLIGYSDGGSVSNSYATGTVIGGAASGAGGLIGFNSDPIDSASYSTGNVSVGANGAAGGLIGVNLAPLDSMSSSATVTGGASASVGGLVGYNGAPITNSHATGIVTVASGTGDDRSYAGGLVGQSTPGGTIANSWASGSVTGGDDSFVGGLVGYAGDAISFSYATGTVTMGSGGNVGGLVGENLGPIMNSYATGAVVSGDEVDAGGLSGYSDPTGPITSSYATGSVIAGQSTDAGGLVGYNDGTITTSFSTGNVAAGSGSWVGGLSGGNDTGVAISQSYATGTVSASGTNNFVGGLVGDAAGPITDTYARGSVSAADNTSTVGGLVGNVESTGTIASSYSIGAVTPSGIATGGLIGINAGTSNVISSYWDTTTSGQTTSAAGIGLTTSQWLMQGPVAGADPAWDFTNNWVAGYPYPVLKAFPYVVATLAPNGARSYGGTDPGFTITSAVDQNGNNALNSITGSLTPVTVASNTSIGTYNAGGSGQAVAGSQLTYLSSMTIDPATITLTGPYVDNKVYDGTTAATLSLGSVVLSGLLFNDNVTLSDESAAAVFGNKNAGSNKTVSVTGISLTGPGASNYVLAPTETTANITPATLTATFNPASKVYDGTTTATASSVGSLTGIIGNDSVAYQSATFNFSDPNAANNKSVTGSAVNLSGPDAGNYTVVLVQNGSASITPAQLYYVAQPGSNRPFGANNPVFSGTISGFVGGDTLASTTTGTPVFTTLATSMSGVGSYGLFGSGLTLTTGNYTLAQSPTNGTALSIGPITITIGNATKFAGSPTPPFTISYSGPTSPYLESILSSLIFATNAPANDLAGTYQITALIPAALAGDILIQPGTLTIDANFNNAIASSTPQSRATLPAAFAHEPPPTPPLIGGLSDSSSANSLVPANANGIFQIVVTPSDTWNGIPIQGTTVQGNPGNALSHASFTETSPNGQSNSNKSVYAAGAH